MSADEPQRHELFSQGWLAAFRRYLEERATRHKLDFKATLSMEYWNPPAHLLKDPASKTIGWALKIDDGNVELFDTPRHHGADIVNFSDYTAMLETIHLSNADFAKWNAANAMRIREEGKLVIIGNTDLLSLTIFMRPFRDEFFAKVTAEPGKTEAGRYEVGSAGWVDALRTYVEQKYAGKTFGFTGTFAMQFTDPPSHLVREGAAPVGWTLRSKHGKVEILDGAVLHEADLVEILDYDRLAPTMAMTTAEYEEWYALHGAELEEAGKITHIGQDDVIKLGLFMIPFRDEFYVRYTA